MSMVMGRGGWGGGDRSLQNHHDDFAQQTLKLFQQFSSLGSSRVDICCVVWHVTSQTSAALYEVAPQSHSENLAPNPTDLRSS